MSASTSGEVTMFNHLSTILLLTRVDLEPSYADWKEADGHWYSFDWHYVSNIFELLDLEYSLTSSSSIIASVIKVVVSFEITNAGINTMFDPDCLLLLQYLSTTADCPQVTVSTILYWSMIEAGLGIIAACLPTLHFLVRKTSIASIVNSVRSAFSLPSLNSERSENLPTQPSGPYKDIRADSETASNVPTLPDSDSSNLIAMKKLNRSEASANEIYVSRQFLQQDDMV